MDDWEADTFELAPLPDAAAEEEAFVGPASSADIGGTDDHHRDYDEAADYDYDDASAAAADTFPAMIVDLAAFRADHPEASIAELRRATLETLASDWTDKSAELMAAACAWHVPRATSADHRATYEAAHPSATLSVFEYPSTIASVPVLALWQTVTRPTPWEVVDRIKRHLAQARRPLKWQADIALEIEKVAAHEDEEHEARRERKDGENAPDEDEDDEAEDGSDVAGGGGGGSGGSAAAAFGCQPSRAAGGGGRRRRPSLVDVVLDMVFQHYPNEPPPPGGSGWTERAVEAAAMKHDLRRMWRSTFGRLPPASDMVLKHASASGAGRGKNATTRGRQVVRRGQPRMLVPGPPPAMSGNTRIAANVK